VYKVPFKTAANKNALFVCLLRKQIHPKCHKTCIFFTLKTFFYHSSRFLSILWKLNNLNFGQVSLNLTHCTASQTDIEPRYSGPDSTLEPFGFPSAVCYTIVIPENWQRDATNTLTFSSLDATDRQSLSEKWPRDAPSKPRLEVASGLSVYDFVAFPQQGPQ
jgi:hypothetical protein